MNEQDALLALNAVGGIGSSGIRKLLEYYGSAARVLSLSEADLLSDSAIPSKIIQSILRFPKDKFLKTEYNLINKRQVKIVTWSDDAYPESLREISGAPIVLYVKGDLPARDSLSIAIVGSRKSSYYGVSTSQKFAVRLAEFGFNVISGMARGIDAAAHKGALESGGTTVAVLGNGLNNIYPPENRKLFGEIAESGAVISEFPMGTMPLPHNFPRRNRIISGLSLGVIVVEAAERSGALITADFALEQGREVFAVPGKIDHSSSKGVHNLIKQGAKLVTCVEDILEDIKPHVAAHIKGDKDSRGAGVSENKSRISGAQLKKLSNEEKLVFENITDRPVHIDELANSCGPAVPVMSILLQLELKHLVKQLPGKLFVHR